MQVTLNVPVGDRGQLARPACPSGRSAGLITFTPPGGSNNGVALRVPYYLVPRALSDI